MLSSRPSEYSFSAVFGLLAQLVEHLGQAAALDHLHREEQALLGIDAQLVDRHDVGMFELAGDLRFLDEAQLLARGRPGRAGT